MAPSWCKFADSNTRNNLATVYLVFSAAQGNERKHTHASLPSVKLPLMLTVLLHDQQDPAFEFSGQNFSLTNTM